MCLENVGTLGRPTSMKSNIGQAPSFQTFGFLQLSIDTERPTLPV